MSRKVNTKYFIIYAAILSLLLVSLYHASIVFIHDNSSIILDDNNMAKMNKIKYCIDKTQYSMLHYAYIDGIIAAFHNAELNNCCTNIDTIGDITLYFMFHGIEKTSSCDNANTTYYISYNTENCFMYHKSQPSGRVTNMASQLHDNYKSNSFILDYSYHHIKHSSQCYPQYTNKAIYVGFNNIVSPYLLTNKSFNFFKSIDEETFMSGKKHDVVLIGTMKLHKHNRRKPVCDLLNKYKIKTECLADYFLDDFEELMKTTKILINIHFYGNAVLETHRLSQALIWKVPVVSEPSNDPALDELWADKAGVIFHPIYGRKAIQYEFMFILQNLLRNDTKRQLLGEKGRNFIINSVQNNNAVCNAMDKICNSIATNKN